MCVRHHFCLFVLNIICIFRSKENVVNDTLILYNIFIFNIMYNNWHEVQLTFSDFLIQIKLQYINLDAEMSYFVKDSISILQVCYIWNNFLHL